MKYSTRSVQMHGKYNWVHQYQTQSTVRYLSDYSLYLSTVGLVNDFQKKERGFLENYWMKSCKDFGDTGTYSSFTILLILNKYCTVL